MDEVELAARKTAKAPVRAVLRLFSEEMADFAEHNEVGVIHYRILDVYKALCGLTSCLDSDDPKLTSGAAKTGDGPPRDVEEAHERERHMILDPINLTAIFAAIAWPLFGWLAVRSICAAVAAVGRQETERLKLHQQHAIVQAVQAEAQE